MTDVHAIEAARRRVREAEEKFDRQTRRYALMTVPSDAGTKVGSSEKGEAAKALLAELEAELEAAKEALLKLERDPK
ncbi:hypothetical protein [Dongia sp.]|uniref:hypothetical protein n=1 Tax=Dongia sp. TaxID=1977262 RepID=UPI003752C23C